MSRRPFVKTHIDLVSIGCREARRGDIMKYAIICGDERSRWLRRLLTDDGHRVSSFGLGLPEDEKSPEEAISLSDCVIFPLPMLSSDEIITAPFSDKKLSLEALRPMIPDGAFVLGGRVPEAAPFPIVDYFRREELTVRNASLTAEGAVFILMKELSSALSDSNIIIVGAGRIGKLLAVKLKALGASVTVTARREGDFALIRELGCDWCKTADLKLCADEAEAIVNTVPARVIDGSVMRKMKKEAIILDLASSPFGHEQAEAASLGVRAMLAPGLPGRAAPKSAAMAVRDTIYNIINERECSA